MTSRTWSWSAASDAATWITTGLDAMRPRRFRMRIGALSPRTAIDTMRLSSGCAARAPLSGTGLRSASALR